MSKPIRVGVVGVGYLGKFHAKIYTAMPDVHLVGVADTDAATREAIAREYGCAPYANAADLVGKVDAVSIVVPTVYHLETARPFLESGTHMLMEKPLAPSLDEALTLVELAERAGVVFQVGHLERFNAGMMELARRAKAPRFIEVHRLGGFVERATDVDVVTDLMIHDIDIVLDLVQRPIKAIAATGVPIMTDHVDIANARLEFEGGAVANVTASRVSTKKQRRIRVFAHNAYYALDFMDQQVEVAEAVPDPAGGRPAIRQEKIAVAPRPPLDAELAAFIECVRTRSTPLVTGRAALAAMDIAMQVKQRIHECLKP